MRKIAFIAADLCLMAFYSLITLLWIEVKRSDASSYYPGDITDGEKLETLISYPAVLLFVLALFLWPILRNYPHRLRWAAISVLINFLVYIPFLYNSLYS